MKIKEIPIFIQISAIMGAAHVGIEVGLKHEFPTAVFFVMLNSTLAACFGMIALAKEQGLIMNVVSYFDYFHIV